MSLLAAYTMPHPPILIEEVGHEMRDGIMSTIHGVEEVAMELARMDVETAVIISPHRRVFGEGPAVMDGAEASGDLSYFRAPSVRLQLPMDEGFRSALAEEYERLAVEQAMPALVLAPTEPLDHGTLVPLVSLARAGFTPRSLVVLSIGWAGADSHVLLGRAIAAAAATTGRRTVLLASGDLSHRLTPDAPAGYSKHAHLFDEAVCDAYQKGDPSAVLRLGQEMVEEAGECGLRSLGVVAGCFPAAVESGASISCRLISYEGPFGVGYMVASVVPEEPIGKSGSATGTGAGNTGSARYQSPADVARAVVESYVEIKNVPGFKEADLPDALKAAPAGCFVTIKSHGELRGCIGSLAPTRSTMLDELIHSAVSACTHDPRFKPVTAMELEDLTYSVDILGEPERISGIDELDPREYGVIVESGGHKGLLLPDLQGVDDAETQVSIATSKAGLPPDVPVQLSRFRVHRYGESGPS